MSGGLRQAALSLYYLASGRGGGFLARKRAYHQARTEAEAALFEEARRHPERLLKRGCPVCGAPAQGPALANPSGFKFARCPADATLFMSPAPSPEALSALYNHPAYALSSPGRPEPASPGPDEWAELEALERLGAPSAGRLLDVGCARGAFLGAAASRYEASGVELNAGAAEAARRGGHPVHTGQLEGLPAEARFELITMHQLIEHLLAPQALLEAARVRLAPGGALYLNTPSADAAGFSRLGGRHHHISTFGHVSLFTRAGLEALAEAAGFELVAYEAWGRPDLAVHDLLTLRLAPGRFRHRMALYSPRAYYLGELLEQSPLGRLFARAQAGPLPYQRALLRPKAP